MASAQLTRTPSSASNLKTWTWSGWIKRSKLGNGSGGNQVLFEGRDGSGFVEKLQITQDDLFEYDHDIAGQDYTVNTTAKFKDVNGWYHIVWTKDTTQSTEADRIKLWVNGTQISLSESQLGYPPLNYDGLINTTGVQYIGANAGSEYFDGLMAHVNFVDGTALTPTSFGETDATTGIWKPKVSPSVTYGTNGYFMKFDNSANMGLDSAGSNNYATSGSIIQTKDTPSNLFATGNPLSARHPVLSSVNNNIFFDETGQWRAVYSTLGASSGKYYMEAKVDAVGGEASIGVIPAEIASQNQDTGDYLGKETDSIGYLNNGRTFKSNSQLQTGLTSMSSGTIVGVALDLDNNTVQFYNNNSAVGNAIATTADTIYLFGFSGYSDTRFYANFGNGYFNTTAVASAENPDDGNGIFEYDPPSGFRALSTKSLNAEEYS